MKTAALASRCDSLPIRPRSRPDGSRGNSTSRSTAGLLLAGLATAVLLAGCSAAPEPHALTEEQADLLAVVRFTTYTGGVTGFHGTVASPAGTLVLTGRVDYARSVGYGFLRTEPDAGYGSSGPVEWTPRALVFLAGGPDAAAPPGGQWQLRPLQPAGSELDAALALLLGLASDRPDNAQLLRQSDARWLRTDTVGGEPADVFEGPRAPGAGAGGRGRLRYWVDGAARLRRVEAWIGAAERPATFDFTPGGAEFPTLPALSR